MVNSSAAFSPDFVTARQRFREATARLGWELETHRIKASGPTGEDLTIDVALSPSHVSDKALVVSSGVHGVEGFFGSAVQLGLLERWAIAPQEIPTTRCLFLHALNPFGFAWLRRCDENNVDPNRNFLLPGEVYQGSPPGYVNLDALLNRKRPPSAWEPFALKALLAITRHGMPRLKQAIAAGQYEFPQGVFYGGAAPSRMHELLEQNLARWLHGAREVVHFDFHTGLGAWATCKLLLDYQPTDAQRDRLTNWFGAASLEACDAEGIAYNARGGIGQWCVARSPARDYLFVCAEFGTYGPIQVLGGLRAENQAHHWGKPGDSSTWRAKQRLKELFCPASPEWRQRAAEHSFRLVNKVVDGMSSQTIA